MSKHYNPVVWERSTLLRRAGLKTTELAILLAISDRLGQNESAWPSYQTLAKDAAVSKRTAIRVCQELEKRGILIIRHRYQDKEHSSNEYIINWKALEGGSDPVSPPSDRVSPPSDRMSPPSDRVALGGSDRVSPPSDRVSPPSDRVSPKPINETLINLSKEHSMKGGDDSMGSNRINQIIAEIKARLERQRQEAGSSRLFEESSDLPRKPRDSETNPL